MESTVPIIVPFKEVSKRCPNKNFVLFPYAMEWLEGQNVPKEAIYVVSKSGNVKQFVNQYGVNFVHEKDREHPNDIIAVTDVASEFGFQKFIFLPLTQPIRSKNLISDVVEAMEQDCDFVTTYQIVVDRSLFYLDSNLVFLNESKNRKGCMCKEMKMLDGAIYGIKLSFAQKILSSEDINAAFWAGKFKAIENDVDFFIDIDTARDMRKFNLLKSNWF